MENRGNSYRGAIRAGLFLAGLLGAIPAGAEAGPADAAKAMEKATRTIAAYGKWTVGVTYKAESKMCFAVARLPGPGDKPRDRAKIIVFKDAKLSPYYDPFPEPKITIRLERKFEWKSPVYILTGNQRHIMTGRKRNAHFNNPNLAQSLLASLSKTEALSIHARLSGGAFLERDAQVPGLAEALKKVNEACPADDR
ncbi:MAG: hypothetical protein ACE5EM_09640 [Sphingomonadales bacterium]